MLSPKRNWKGFKISKNLKNAIKNSLYVLVPAILAEFATNNLITSSAAGIVGSAICKAVEFYFTEIEA